MKNIKVSIVVLTYNSSKYICEALDSILSQEHNYSIEIVIGDDCSTDGTVEILKKYKALHGDIINLILNSVNMGILKNYFNVIAHCNGEYLMGCAGDDYWLPGKLKKQVDYMDKNLNVGALCAKCVEYIEETHEMMYLKYEPRLNFNRLLFGNNIYALSHCTRKKIMDKFIIEVNPMDKDWLMEDYPKWLYISKNSRIDFLDEYVAVYRNRKNSACHQVSIDKKIKFEKSVFEIAKYFAGDDLKLQKIALYGHCERMASFYYDIDDFVNYRKYAKQTSDCKSMVKYYISYLPYTKQIRKLFSLIKKYSLLLEVKL